jgi:hypothetical protein
VEVLRDVLGYDHDAIRRLLLEKVVATYEPEADTA